MFEYMSYLNHKQIKSLSHLHGYIEEQEALGQSGGLVSVGSNPYGEVYGIVQENHKLPHFVHPITTNAGKCYVDTRAYLTGTGTVRYKIDRTFALQRGHLALAAAHGPEFFESIIPQVSALFGAWVAGTMVSRFNADINDEVLLKIAATSYYVALMLKQISYAKKSGDRYEPQIQPDEDHGDYLDAEELSTICLRIMGNRGLGIPTTFVEEALEDGIIHTLTNTPQINMAVLLKLIDDTGEFKMGEADIGTLSRLMGGGSWQGMDAINLAITGMESMSVMTSMVAFLGYMPSYRNRTRIGQAYNTLFKRMDMIGVHESVVRLMGAYHG